MCIYSITQLTLPPFDPLYQMDHKQNQGRIHIYIYNTYNNNYDIVSSKQEMNYILLHRPHINISIIEYNP